MRSAKDCSRPHGPTTFGPAAHLHRRPDLAVGVEMIGDEDQQHDEQQHELLTNMMMQRQR